MPFFCGKAAKKNHCIVKNRQTLKGDGELMMCRHHDYEAGRSCISSKRAVYEGDLFN